MPNLGLPVINDQCVQVTLSNEQSHTENQEEWMTMERELVEENIAEGFFSGSKKALALQQHDDNRVVCAVGGEFYYYTHARYCLQFILLMYIIEPAIVHIELHNPLQVSIELNDIVLGCVHRESMKPTKESRDAKAEAYEAMIEGTPVPDSNEMFDFGGDFHLQKITNLTLEPLEKRQASLLCVCATDEVLTAVSM